MTNIEKYLELKAKTLWLWANDEKLYKTHYEPDCVAALIQDPDDIELRNLDNCMHQSEYKQSVNFDAFTAMVLVERTDVATYGDSQSSFILNIVNAFKDYQLLK